jgi:hypothetical protein
MYYTRPDPQLLLHHCDMQAPGPVFMQRSTLHLQSSPDRWMIQTLLRPRISD